MISVTLTDESSYLILNLRDAHWIFYSPHVWFAYRHLHCQNVNLKKTIFKIGRKSLKHSCCRRHFCNAYNYQLYMLCKYLDQRWIMKMLHNNLGLRKHILCLRTVSVIRPLIYICNQIWGFFIIYKMWSHLTDRCYSDTNHVCTKQLDKQQWTFLKNWSSECDLNGTLDEESNEYKYKMLSLDTWASIR